MKEMVCIVCPLGCRLSVDRVSDSELRVSGNNCPRGERYAMEELLNPRRVVTATCLGQRSAPSSASAWAPRRVPLRTTKAFPREKIPELLRSIYGLSLDLPVRVGQIAITDALGTGIDVIVTRSME